MQMELLKAMRETNSFKTALDVGFKYVSDYYEYDETKKTEDIIYCAKVILGNLDFGYALFTAIKYSGNIRVRVATVPRDLYTSMKIFERNENRKKR